MHVFRVSVDPTVPVVERTTPTGLPCLVSAADADHAVRLVRGNIFNFAVGGLPLIAEEIESTPSMQIDWRTQIVTDNPQAESSDGIGQPNSGQAGGEAAGTS